MTRRRLKIQTDTGRNSMIIRGWGGGALAREAGCWPVYSGSAGGWIVDLPRLSDLAAYLEYRSVAYSVTEVGDAG
jgi:hypothetical protein